MRSYHTNGTTDIFVHDRQTGTTTRVSVDSQGNQANGASIFAPAISADGGFVVFHSSASNLVAGDTNGTGDVFVHDRQTGTTTRVSVDSQGSEGNGDSRTVSISADGRFVAFHSNASNLVAGDTNNTTDVFVHDRGSLAADTDGDGVDDPDDLCPDTVIPESVPTVRLGTNRWALTDDPLPSGDIVFDTKKPKGKGPNRSYTTTDTGGCSCEQIIEQQGLGNGHTKFGCSISAMDDWVALVNPSKRGAGADATEVAEVPTEYELGAAYPNPFNPQTTIRFALPESAQVTLVVYDVLGRQVRVLVDGVREAGTHEVVFEASDLPSGTYLYRLETPQGSFVQMMQLVK